MELQTERLLLQPRSYDADGHVTEWAIAERASGLTIGRIGFFGREPDDCLVVGYEIASEWSGRGLATEALTAVLGDVAANGQAATVVAETEQGHSASRRVMEKAGMQLLSVDGGRVRYGYLTTLAVRSTP
jgi:RimJ/RimL family protein N-acetyltransferase